MCLQCQQRGKVSWVYTANSPKDCQHCGSIYGVPVAGEAKPERYSSVSGSSEVEPKLTELVQMLLEKLSKHERPRGG